MQIYLIRKTTGFKISQYKKFHVFLKTFVLMFTVSYKIWKLGRVGHSKKTDFFSVVKPSCFYGSAYGV